MVLVLGACGGDHGVPPADAGADSGIDAGRPDGPTASGLDGARTGERCSGGPAHEGWFCDAYSAVCAHGTCRSQCSAHFPACPDGQVRTEETLSGGDWCFCVPE